MASLSAFVALVAWLMAAGSEREAAFERFDLISAALKRGGPVRCRDVKAQIALLEERGLITGQGGRLVTEIVVRAEHAILDPARQGRVARGQVGTCGSRQFRHKYLGTGRCRTAAEQGAFARWTFERDGAVSGLRRGRRIALRLPCTKGTRCYRSWTPK